MCLAVSSHNYRRNFKRGVYLNEKRCITIVIIDELLNALYIVCLNASLQKVCKYLTCFLLYKQYFSDCLSKGGADI